MIKEGLLEKVSGIKDMPNYKYVAKQFQNPSFDPMQEYSTHHIKWVLPDLLLELTHIQVMAHL